MKKILILSTALTAVSFACAANEVTVMSWGGAYTTSQVEAYHKPFTAETGIAVVSVDAPARLSTMIVCLSSSVSFGLISRDRMSVPPPGAAGTMMRIGLVGKFCAVAYVANSTTAARVKAQVLYIFRTSRWMDPAQL